MYKLSGLAAEDFTAIYEYTLLNFGVAKADEYTGSLESTLQLLSAEPGMGRECPEITAGIRRHDHLKHVIFYLPREQVILIVRMLHQQMEPLIHFTELL